MAGTVEFPSVLTVKPDAAPGTNFPISEYGGQKITAATMPAGGAGILGWLSALSFDSASALATITGYTALSVGGQPVSDTSPMPMRLAQKATVTFDVINATAGQSGQLMVAGVRNGGRILNYMSSPIYIAPGTIGNPVSGAPSDFVPAALNGEPGQYNFDFAPTMDLRYITAATGAFAVILW